MDSFIESRKRVAIIGAGISGLVSLKEALATGLQPVLFESKSELGGLWSKNEGSMWDSLKTNLSKYTCCFSDFPFPEDTNDFPSHTEIFDYLNNYCDHFNLIQYIKLNKKVIKITKGISYAITTKDLISDEITTESFDYVIISTGIFSKKKLPVLEGINRFKGSIIHSSEYRNPSSYIDKNIVIVGSSFSAIEIANDIVSSDENTKVSLIMNRPNWVIPRIIPSPNGQMLPLDLVFYRRGGRNNNENLTIEELNLNKNNYFRGLSSNQEEFHEALKFDNLKYPPYVAISDNKNFLNNIIKKRIELTNSKILQIDKKLIKLEESIHIEADVIIFATGFNCNLSFLDENIKKIIEYDESDNFKPFTTDSCVFHPELENLAFIGLYKGPYFAVIELQARLATLKFAGLISDIPKEEMKFNLNLDRKLRTINPRPQFPHGDYVGMCDYLAKRIDVLPDLEKIEKDDIELFNYLVNGPLLPQHFRLFGMHSMYNNAYREIRRINSLIK